MACCGRSCNVQFDDGSGAGPVEIDEAFIGEINVEGEAVDVTHFGDLAAGTTIVCKESATFVVNTYVDPEVSVGDTVAFSCNVCSNAYSATLCDVMTKNCRFEASGIPVWVTTLKIEGTVTNF